MCVTKAQASYCFAGLCVLVMQKTLLMCRRKSEWEDGRKCAVCESSRLKSCFRSSPYSIRLFWLFFPDYYLREVHKAQYLALFSQSCEACILYAPDSIQ